MGLDLSKLAVLSFIASLFVLTAAVDVEKFSREVLPFVRMNILWFYHPSNAEDPAEFFPVPWTRARFTASESSLTSKSIWVKPATVYSQFSFSEPEDPLVREILAGLGDLTKYEISFTNGEMDDDRVICEHVTIANRGTENEVDDSILMDMVNKRYPVPRNLDHMDCQASLPNGFGYLIGLDP